MSGCAEGEGKAEEECHHAHLRGQEVKADDVGLHLHQRETEKQVKVDVEGHH